MKGNDETNRTLLATLSIANETIVERTKEFGIYEYNETKLSHYTDEPYEIQRASFYVHQLAFRSNIARARRMFADEVVLNLNEKLKSGDKLSDRDQIVICTILHRLIRCGLQLDAISCLEKNKSVIAAPENKTIFGGFVKSMIFESLFKYWDREYCKRWYKLYFDCFDSEEENVLSDVDGINALIFDFAKSLRGYPSQFNKIYSRKQAQRDSRLFLLKVFDSYYHNKFDSIELPSQIATFMDSISLAVEISGELEHASFPELLASVWYLVQCMGDDLCVRIILDMDPADETEDNYIWLNSFLFEKNITLPNGIKRYLDKLDGFVSYDKVSNLISIARIYSYVSSVKRLLRADQPQKLMYYTTYNTLLYMMPHALSDIKKTEITLETENLAKSSSNSCAMWAFMNVGYMNDPNEGKAAKMYFNILQNINNNVSYSDVYLKSFTSRRDDLSMWEMYGDHAAGCFVSIDWSKTKKENRNVNVPFVYKVLYMTASDDGTVLSFDRDKNEHIAKDKLEKINELMKKIKSTIDAESDEDIKESMLLATERIWYLIKDSSYWHEAENRILYDEKDSLNKLKYTGGEVPKVYLQGEFRLYFDEIMFGPKSKDVIEKTIFLDKQFGEIKEAYGINPPVISVSAIHYK